ncbi:leucine-rich repeats and immunoglobulin-like domains protein 3 [Nyctibius grandis]|uniref:leucine-rich repeats and immunoglobulin-like domains protein 3 n=1 Tax=Nyctibius grandis TaxID=48427 RepID=UPI0035BC8A81
MAESVQVRQRQTVVWEQEDLHYFWFYKNGVMNCVKHENRIEIYGQSSLCTYDLRFALEKDLSHNKLSSIKTSLLDHLHSLREVKLNNNELEIIPDLGPVSANITLLSLTSNKISNILSEHLKPFQSLETLDLSNNNISELKISSFPSLQLKYLYINSNRITSMEPGTFDNLSTTLQVLKLNRNKISAVPQKMFKLSHLQHLYKLTLTTLLLDKHQELAFTFEFANRINHDILGLQGFFKSENQETINYYLSSVSERQNRISMVKHNVLQ